jgi:hypothetical protein
MSEAPPTPPSWRILVTPRWLSWHLFAIVAVAGMIWLGDWQLRRAMAGNALSWAYTFEWPIFAIFGVVFWIKTIRDELHPPVPDEARAAQVTLPAGSYQASAEPAHGGSDRHGDVSEDEAASDEPDRELAEYNAYLAKLGNEVKGHGRWHGLR